MNPKNFVTGKEILRKVVVVSIGDDCMVRHPDYADKFIRAAELGYDEVTGTTNETQMKDIWDYFNMVPLDVVRDHGRSIVDDFYRIGRELGIAVLNDIPVRYTERTSDGQLIEKVFGGDKS